MVANNQSPYHTAFTVSIEAREGVTTGISAADRAHTIQVAIDEKTRNKDLVTPGHVFPLRARDGGVLVRSGQTEGSVDLARLAGLKPAGVICEIMKDDGTMARLPDLLEFGKEHGIRIVAVADLIRWRMRNETLIKLELDTKSQIGELGEFRIRVYRTITDGRIHMALSKGDVLGNEPILTRVQAASHGVDVFGFSSSDSNTQLEVALQKITEIGKGVFLYLNIAGEDSERALKQLNLHLGNIKKADLTKNNADGTLREMGAGAQILVNLGVRQIRLMTNNPRKIVGLEAFGLEVVERVPLVAPSTTENKAFLTAKRLQLGHMLETEA